MADIIEAKFYEDLYADIKNVLTVARNKAVVAVNTAMVHARTWTWIRILGKAENFKLLNEQ